MMTIPLNRLHVGARFKFGEDSVTGTLVHVTMCSALVELDLPKIPKRITDRHTGNVKTFYSKNPEARCYWAPDTPVEPISTAPPRQTDGPADGEAKHEYEGERDELTAEQAYWENVIAPQSIGGN